MKLVLLVLSMLTAAAMLAPAALAQRQDADGAGTIQLTTTGETPAPVPLSDGELDGVDMTNSATTGTLAVGTVGGVETDIDTSNDPLVPGVVAVSTSVNSNGNIVFNSGSTVYGAIGQSTPPLNFLDIYGGNTGTVVNFLGPVHATTFFVTGAGSMNFESGTPNDGASIFASDGTISLSPGSSLNGAITSTAGADTGTLVLGAGSLVNGAIGGGSGLKEVEVLGGSDAAGVSATIQGAADVYTMSLGTNTLLINGALALASSGAGGTVDTTIASDSLYGNVRVLGATSLGPSVTVNVTVPSTADLTVGTVFDIIQIQTGTTQTGTSGSLVVPVVAVPTNPLYTFVPVPLAGTLAGLVAIEVTAVPLLVPITPPVTPVAPVIPLQPVAAPLVPVLIALPATPAVVTLIGAINTLTTPAAVVTAVAQLAPSAASLAVPEALLQGVRAFEDLWLSRLQPICGDVNRRDDAKPPSCQGFAPAGWWLKGVGYAGQQGGGVAYPGYNNDIYGTMIGYDAPLGPDARVGIGIGYDRSTITEKKFTADDDSNNYTAMAYAGRVIGPWFVDGDLSFGWNDYSESRQISFTGYSASPHGSYSGQTYSAFGMTGFNLFAAGLTLTPLASLQYTYVTLGGYSESGAGPIGLKINGQNYSYLESGLGGQVSDQFDFHGGTLEPEIHAKWLHEIDNPAARETATFLAAGSASFTPPAFKSGNDILNIGAATTLLSCGCVTKAWSLEAAYDFYDQAGGYTANEAMLKYTRSF
jgi:uncharacterized protein with beta-barrel porin domain